MALIELSFACGCPRQKVDVDKNPSPTCLHCGNGKVARTYNVQPPRFTGCVRGPLATTTALEPIAVNLAQTPLTLNTGVPNAQ